MAKIIRDHLKGGVLIVAHRIELIGQIAHTLEVFGVAHGVVDSRTRDVTAVMRTHHVVVASIQTLSKRMVAARSRRLGLVIVDEAHHTTAMTYRLLWETWPTAKFLGLTATPCRLNKAGFTDLFDELLESWDIQTFIDKGYLSDFDYVTVAPENWMLGRIRGLQKRDVNGDYQTKEMATVLDTAESLRHLYATYRRYANGKKGIVYAINREHARHIAEYYQAQGARCCWIEAKTPAEERRALVAGYIAGQLDIIVNVDIFSEGFDCPEVEFIQLARPTLSLSKYMQQVGRGMRVSKGKEGVIILDQVGMYHTFGLLTACRDWHAMFEGRKEGKGQQGQEQPIVVHDPMPHELTLQNLDMVRVKQRGEQHEGLEVYMQGGAFGVMRDGMVTCQPMFRQIKRLRNPKYFALAIYAHGKYPGLTTVIDCRGYDLRMGLLGEVTLEDDDFFKGQNVRGMTVYWDAVGRCYYYQKKPDIKYIGDMEVVHVVGDSYKLRRCHNVNVPFVNRRNIMSSDDMAIVEDMLVLKKDYQAYKILGFLGDSVLVMGDKVIGYQQIMANGNMGKFFELRPQGMTPVPDFQRLHLKKVE